MEHFALNLQLFNLIYAGSQPAMWCIQIAEIVAKDLILLFPLLLVYIYFNHPNNRAFLFNVTIAVVGACGISYLCGHFFTTARPFVDLGIVNYGSHAPDAAFPSDHTTVATAIAASFLFNKKWLWGILLTVLTLMIGWARVYLGIHYPLDIMGGLLIGSLSAFLVHLWVRKPIEKWLAPK